MIYTFVSAALAFNVNSLAPATSMRAPMVSMAAALESNFVYENRDALGPQIGTVFGAISLSEMGLTGAVVPTGKPAPVKSLAGDFVYGDEKASMGTTLRSVNVMGELVTGGAGGSASPMAGDLVYGQPQTLAATMGMSTVYP